MDNINYSDITTINRKFLKEILSTLEHAQVFISTKEKMHPDGRKLYQDNIDRLKKVISYE